MTRILENTRLSCGGAILALCLAHICGVREFDWPVSLAGFIGAYVWLERMNRRSFLKPLVTEDPRGSDSVALIQETELRSTSTR